MSSPYNVFNVAYNGVARSLITHGIVQDPISQAHHRFEKLIWDTGATNSTVNKNVVQALGLVPTGITNVHTANGVKQSYTYVINIVLPNKVKIEGINVSEGDLGDNADMLIGMDIIGTGDFTVQNIDGKTHFSFCQGPLPTKYDMMKKADGLNAQAAASLAAQERKPSASGR